MAASDDRNAGTNRGRIQGQISKISNWMDGARFEHAPGGTDIDRVIAQIDWRAEIDPTLDASTNYAIIKDKLGLMTATDIKLEARKADDKARDSARRAIRENLAAIEAGDPDGILDDVEAEYGPEFVAAELGRARAEADPELGGAPEPKDWSPSAPGATATEPPDPAPEPGTADSPPRDRTPDPTPDAPLIPAHRDDAPVSPTPKRTPSPPGRTFVRPELPAAVPAVLSAALAPLKVILLVLYVLLTAPVDATDPEVAGHV